MTSSLNVIGLLGGFYQLGYVTHDLEAAVSHLKRNSGAEFFLYLDKMVFLDARFRGKPSQWSVRVAQTMTGNVNVEIIEPVSGDAADEVFRPFLSSTRVITLNHVATFVGENDDEWAHIKRSIHAHGYPFVISGDVPGMGNLGYIDTVREFGHYVELHYLTEDAREYPAKLKRRDPGLEVLGKWI